MWIAAAMVVAWGCRHGESRTCQAVNSVVGDISFVERFGRLPDASADEDLRIRTHLAYIENLLRQRGANDMPFELRRRRARLLDLLHAYWSAGDFPRNFGHPGERMPCFIDKNGRICAVGYLIEHTVGRGVAERINRNHQDERILAMNDPAVDGWIAWSGLTKEECASIQPAYEFQSTSNPNHISRGYGLSSALFSAANVSLGAINVLQMSRERRTKAIPFFGIVTGAGQVILGAIMMPREIVTANGNQTNESEKILSLINIGLGSTTMILSMWNLVTIPEQTLPVVGWNMYCVATPGGGVGVRLIHNF